MELHRIETGGGRPLVILHGLFGQARNWGAVARRLAADRRVVAVDLRNHGDSPWADSHGYEEMADDVARVIRSLGGRADLLGHSMGGKAAMTLALDRPELVDRLIVADIAPLPYDHTQIGYVHAMQAVDLDRVARRADADRQLADFVPEATIREFLTQSIAIGPEGARWKLNLPVLERDMPRILSFPETAARFEGPTLVLRGARSAYVTDRGSAAFARLFPEARIETLAGTGHWLHAERPAAFADRVAAFLDQD